LPSTAPAYDVAVVQRQLTEQRYYLGAVDGKAGSALKSAVMAFQKVNGR
jgi:peptidoglycan hydrolase-like protein with peptidoglycan-binding domain